MAGPGGSSDLDLPDWNVAFKEDSFDCSPVKQPLVQVSLKDGNTQRVSALGRPGAAAAAPALKPLVAAPAPAAQPEAADCNAENEHAASTSAAAEPPRSVRRTHTPSRTGLTSRAVRLPSRLGVTPGAKQAEQFVVPHSTQAGATVAAAPATAGGAGANLKSILKRLNFSTTKGRGTAAAAASAAPPPSASAAQLHPQSTIKQLRFDAGTTPAAAGTAAKLSHHRHVTFDAGTVSPTQRSGPDVSGVAALAHRTPEPAIPEEEGGSGDEQPAGSSVNSNRAGHTPYDRRLSSLFRKYQEAGTPELPDAELDALVADGAVRSPSWRRLSSASVPESIRELAKRYDSHSSAGSMMSPLAAGPTPPPATADPAGNEAAMEEAGASTPMPAAPGGALEGSPAMDPTPHNVVDSVMKRNALYESPPVQGGEQRQGGAAGAAPAPAAAARQPLSPASAVAQLLAPVLVATIAEIQQDEAAAASPGSAGGGLPSPAAEFGSPHLHAESGTPGASGARSACDGVPRDADGVPAHTPTTVTVRRGSCSSGLRAMEQDDDLAANLFSSFSPAGDGGDGGAVSRPGEEPAAAAAGPAATAQEAAGSPEFSFFPAATSHKQQAAAEAAAAGGTPELPVLHGPGGSTISPEILGFYESQAQQARAGDSAGAGASHAGAGPAIPRSIIKSGRPLNEAGTPVLGHARRGGADGAPPTITRELQALMADLRLEDPAGIEQMGTVPALSPVRAGGSRMRGLLGGLARAITPVRRSARKMAHAPPRPLEAMLEEADFSYVPNAALMPDSAQPKVEEAEAKAARKAASQATEPSLAGTPAAGVQRPEVSSAAASRRYSTRSAARAAGAGTQDGQMQGEAEVASIPGAEVQPVLDGRRLSLRRLRTPLQQAHTWAAGEAATPQATVLAADTPVAQDASPSFAENGADRSYSLRASTVKKRKGGSTPAAAVTPATSGAGAGKEQRATPSPPPQLSPTEQGIRASLRRSARKSQGPR